MISRYQGRISGPILDRIDLAAWCDQPSFEDLIKEEEEDNSLSIRERIIDARDFARERQGDVWNGRMSKKEADLFCRLDRASIQYMKQSFQRFGLTGRSYYRVLKVSRTIADLNRHADIRLSDLQEAMQYRL